MDRDKKLRSMGPQSTARAKEMAEALLPSSSPCLATFGVGPKINGVHGCSWPNKTQTTLFISVFARFNLAFTMLNSCSLATYSDQLARSHSPSHGDLERGIGANIQPFLDHSQAVVHRRRALHRATARFLPMELQRQHASTQRPPTEDIPYRSLRRVELWAGNMLVTLWCYSTAFDLPAVSWVSLNNCRNSRVPTQAKNGLAPSIWWRYWGTQAIA